MNTRKTVISKIAKWTNELITVKLLVILSNTKCNKRKDASTHGFPT